MPPKQWMADLLAYLEQAHSILPTREVVEKLYAIIVQQWREGATVREVGKATCSCQKGQIVPSPAALVQLKRGELKPPRSAKRGDLFGFEELRARKVQEKADAVKTQAASERPKRVLHALTARPALPALPKRTALPASTARKLRTPKKGPILKTETASVPSAPAEPPQAAKPAPVAPPPKPDAARLKATEVKLRSSAKDLEGDDL